MSNNPTTPRPPPPSPAVARHVLDALGGAPRRLTRRTPLEKGNFSTGIKKTDRASLDPAVYGKVKLKAETGMKDKFKLMSSITTSTLSIGQEQEEGPNLLDHTYSVTARIKEFRQAVRTHDMDDVFTVPNKFVVDPSFDNDLVPAPGHVSINLFTDYASLTMSSIKNASSFLMNWGQNYQAENLKWSGQKLLNSCDKVLRAKILEIVTNYDDDHQTGPVYFKVMLDLIMATSSHNIRAMMKKVESLALTDIPGEKVTTATSFLRSAYCHLQNCNSCPNDFFELCVQALTKCSTSEFVLAIRDLNSHFKHGSKDISVDDLLTEADATYTDLESVGKWLAPPGTSGSVFAINTSIMCYRCGQFGHYASQCPLLKAAGAGSTTAAPTTNSSDTGTVSSSGSSSNRRRNGRGKRGGRGGRGTGNSNIDRRPPAAGAPHTRATDGGKQEHWCGTCGRWGNHLTADHRPKGSSQNSANVATTAAPALCQPVSEDSPSPDPPQPVPIQPHAVPNGDGHVISFATTTGATFGASLPPNF